MYFKYHKIHYFCSIVQFYVMDALSKILELIKLKAVVYFNSDFSAPWGMQMSKSKFAQFHMIVNGKCFLRIKSNKTLTLNKGDIVIFPFGTSHLLADNINSKSENGLKVAQSIWDNNPIFKGNNVTTTLICGHFEFNSTINHNFIKVLPDIIHIKNISKQKFSWLKTICNLIIQESETENVGKTLAINRLAEVLFINAIREFIIQKNYDKGFLAALADKNISCALKVIHNAPEKNWTLQKLAKTAGMSRTLFTNKFKTLIGETPMEYVTNWRLLKAKAYLTESNDSVKEIAYKVGYTSNAAFNRIFKKKTLKTPLKYRQLNF